MWGGAGESQGLFCMWIFTVKEVGMHLGIDSEEWHSLAWVRGITLAAGLRRDVDGNGRSGNVRLDSRPFQQSRSETGSVPFWILFEEMEWACHRSQVGKEGQRWDGDHTQQILQTGQSVQPCDCPWDLAVWRSLGTLTRAVLAEWWAWKLTGVAWRKNGRREMFKKIFFFLLLTLTKYTKHKIYRLFFFSSPPRDPTCILSSESMVS